MVEEKVWRRRGRGRSEGDNGSSGAGHEDEIVHFRLI